MLRLALIINFLISSSLFPMEEEQKLNHIFVEIDDVLFEPDPTSGLARLGGSLARVATNFSVDSMHKKLVEIIRLLDSNLPEKEKQTSIKQAIFRGESLPYIWGHYLMGNKTGEEMVTLAKGKVSEILRFYEKPLVNHAITISFTPEKEAGILTPKSEVVEILKKLAQQKNNRLYIFSNKRVETVYQLQQTHQKIFEFFENRIHVSGGTRKLKPNNDAYTTLLGQLNLHPQNCYVIEWEAAYQEAAQQHGLHAISFQNNIGILKAFLLEKALLPAEEKKINE